MIGVFFSLVDQWHIAAVSVPGLGVAADLFQYFSFGRRPLLTQCVDTRSALLVAYVGSDAFALPEFAVSDRL